MNDKDWSLVIAGVGLLAWILLGCLAIVLPTPTHYYQRFPPGTCYTVMGRDDQGYQICILK